MTASLQMAVLDHPGAAAGDDLVKGEVVHHVLGVDAAGGHPLELTVGAGEGLELLDAAVVLGREELDHLEAQGHGLLHLAAGGGAGEHQGALVKAVLHGVGVKAGGDDELGAGSQGAVQTLAAGDGAGADDHIGHLGRDGADGLLGCGGAEGDLGRVEAAGHEGLGQRHGLAGVVNGDDRHDADFGQGMEHFVHGTFLLLSYNIFAAWFSAFIVSVSMGTYKTLNGEIPDRNGPVGF